MADKYFCIELKYDIYFSIIEGNVKITVPAYEIYDKECFINYMSDKEIIIFYCQYIFFYFNRLHTKKILVFDKKNNDLICIPTLTISKKEYMEKSIKINRYLLLSEPYAGTSKKEVCYKYSNVKLFDNSIASLSGNSNLNDLEKIKTGLKWLMSKFSHCSQDNYSMSYSASELIKKGRSFNCRNMAVILNTLYLSWNLKSRYIICLQKEEKLDNSHFMVEVYIKKQKKWVVVDSSYGCLFKNVNGNYLSLRELREYLACNHKVIIDSVDMLKKINSRLYFKSLIIKLYRFRRPVISNDYYNIQGQFIELVPAISFINIKRNNNINMIDTPALFWTM